MCQKIYKGNRVKHSSTIVIYDDAYTGALFFCCPFCTNEYLSESELPLLLMLIKTKDPNLRQVYDEC